MSLRAAVLATLVFTGDLLAQATTASGAGLAFHATSAGTWESNLDHEQSGRQAYGGVVALGIGLRDRMTHPLLELNYEAALHRHTVPSQWDRVSHQGDLTLALYPARWLEWETEGEVSLLGSAEDRDLSNTYQVSQGLKLRFARAVRLKLTAALRQRQYPETIGRDGTSRYLEAELRQQVLGQGWMTLSGKYDLNRSDSLRYRYRRTTWTLGVETGAEAATQLEVEVAYRIQRYRYRRVELDAGRTALRRDFRLTPSATLTHRVTPKLEVALGYAFENRSSNDPSKDYNAHQTSLSITRRW